MRRPALLLAALVTGCASEPPPLPPIEIAKPEPMLMLTPPPWPKPPACFSEIASDADHARRIIRCKLGYFIKAHALHNDVVFQVVGLQRFAATVTAGR